jgi:aminopeptidase N
MYGTGEAHQLRLAMEKVSGKDLNPFFNQWYFNNGHPKLDITYTYSTAANMVTVNIKQTQNGLFTFPLAIDVYEGATPKRYEVLVDEKEKSFSFKYSKKPSLVNVDAEHILLVETNDDKTIENYIFQYNNAPKYEDRRAAIEKLAENQSNEIAFKTLTKALNDKYFGLRILAIEKIDISKTTSGEAIKIIEKLAASDKKTLVQGAAITKLGLLENEKYKDLFTKSLQSKSNAVKGGSLNALYKIDKNAAMSYANSVTDKLEKENLKDALIPLYIKDKKESELPFVANNLLEGMFFTEDKAKQNIYKEGFQWVAASDSEEATQNLVNRFVKMGNQYKQYGADKMAKQVLNQVMAAKAEYNYSNMAQLNKIVEDGLKELE